MVMGVSEGEALRQAMLWSLSVPIVGVALLAGTLWHIDADETNLRDRARALGEAI